MESGIIELAPVFKGNTETTAGEMKEYIQNVVTRFCEITGLVVIETVDHEKGAFFILGVEGKTQGLVAIGNSSVTNAYYATMVISNVGPGNELRIGMNSYGNANSGDGQAYQFQTTPVWMQYARTDHGTAIGLQASASPSKLPFTMAFQKIIDSSGTEELVMLRYYGNALYASYNPVLLNEGKGTALFTLSGFNKNIIPQDKEAVTDIYLESGVELPGMRLYTNKRSTDAWNKVRIGSNKYVIAHAASSGYFSLIMQSSDTVVQG